MKSSSFRRYLLSILCTVFLFASTSLAGDLAPSALPGPTMKNLQTVEPRIPIDSYGFTITEPGSYYLTRNIQMLVGANGINVEADNVTIDLMGFTLSGNGAESASGIYLNGRRNVEIRNGSIRNFGGQGIYEADGVNGKCHRVIDVRVVGNGGDGIHLEGSGHMVRGCTAEGNGTTGIYLRNMGSVIANTAYENGYRGIRAGQGTTIINNTVYSNQNDGIYTQSGCTVTNNTSTANQNNGLSAGNGSAVDGNTVRLNHGDGISVSDVCTVTRNISSSNGYLEGDGAGIHATGANNRIEYNHIIENDRGLDIDAAGNTISSNTVKSNDDNYDIAQGNQLNILLCEVPETIDWPATVLFAGPLASSDPAAHAISVSSNGVTIDMGGFSLTGPGTGSGVKSGIHIVEKGSIEIRNGNISEFGYDGIYAGNVAATRSGIIIENVKSQNNGRYGIRLGGSGHIVSKCVASSNGSDGIWVSSASIIKDCTAVKNSGDGINASSTVIEGNVVYDNEENGIEASTACLVRHNIAKNNNWHGILNEYNGATIIGNMAHLNGRAGIAVIGNSNCVIDQNACMHNDQDAGDGVTWANIDVPAGNTLGTNDD